MNENIVNKSCFMLMKFGSAENLKKLQSGQLYMKNLKYYVDLETKTTNNYIGDKYDGHFVIQNADISLYTIDTHELIAKFNNAKFSMEFGFLEYPVFCMFKLDHRNYVSEYFNGYNFTVTSKFTEEQISKMANFGDSVLIIKDSGEFIKRINNGLTDAGYKFVSDDVQYYGLNNSEYFEQVKNNDLTTAFWKNEKYSYQQEYRLLVLNCVDDYLSIDIGDISDITVLLETEKLLKMIIVYQNRKFNKQVL